MVNQFLMDFTPQNIWINIFLGWIDQLLHFRIGLLLFSDQLFWVLDLALKHAHKLTLYLTHTFSIIYQNPNQFTALI